MALMIVAVFNQGCDKLSSAVEVPSYITIETVDLLVDSTQGTSDHKITDVWVQVGDENLGAYELPATIPILMDGKQDVILNGGIKVNGVNIDRDDYPFYKSTTLSVKLIPGSSVKLQPTFSYYSDLTFAWIEDFEMGSTLKSMSSSDTTLFLEAPIPNAAMGTKSAVIRVDAANAFYFGSTDSEEFILPLGKPVYLELNYLSNIEFKVGAIKHTSFGDETIPHFITIFPSEDWNKIYLDLTKYVNSHTDALSFEIYFICNYDSEVTNNIVYLDNIKLIYK